MTSDDDRLAPVTDLFGARRAADRRAADGEARSQPGAIPAGADSESNSAWARSGVVGDDEAMSVEAPTERESAAPVAVLPTYAAFAARSEGRRTPSVVSGGAQDEVGAADEAAGYDGAGSRADSDEADSDEADSENEPEESFEAAQRRAENISLHALTRRGVSSREMASTLRSRDLPEEVVLAEVERLERVGLLDDAELAENLVRGKLERKGLGKSGVTAELRQRGLAQEAIDAAIDGIDDDEEQSRADEWARKRAGQLRGLDHATAERRLSAYLMRRGYRSEVIRRAIEKALPRGGSPRGGGVRFE
jgi:regulatory protein